MSYWSLQSPSRTQPSSGFVAEWELVEHDEIAGGPAVADPAVPGDPGVPADPAVPIEPAAPVEPAVPGDPEVILGEPAVPDDFQQAINDMMN